MQLGLQPRVALTSSLHIDFNKLTERVDQHRIRRVGQMGVLAQVAGEEPQSTLCELDHCTPVDSSPAVVPGFRPERALAVRMISTNERCPKINSLLSLLFLPCGH